jgi:tRNA-Thr(GGU) m(6)t(6)A37 methyltransferase TsaA
MSFAVKPIGIIHSCFKEKFGIPRQPGLAPAAKAQIELLSPYNNPDAVAGLEQVSHIWLQFLFHQNRSDEWRPKVRPPRLGGNKQMGVFATRSPVRPNPIGLSVVKLESIELNKGVVLNVSGIDLVDGTPILDIKPYVPYVDCVDEAENNFADAVPDLLPVCFSPEVGVFCESYSKVDDLKLLLQQVLQQDPRPQYQTPDPERRYAMKLLDFDIAWHYQKKEGAWQILVTEINSLKDHGHQ